MQDNFNITADTGALFKAAVNAALQSLASCNSGDSAPTTTWPGMLWADTLNGYLKQRNAANDGWNILWKWGSTISDFMFTVLDDLTATAARATLGGADPIGVIKAYGGSTTPTGWLLCNGDAASKTTYAALFAVIGHSFGADPGGGNFILPDLRGRIPLGKDNMGGASANRITDMEADTVGASAGSEGHLHTTGDVTLTHLQSGVPAHNHPIIAYTPAGGTPLYPALTGSALGAYTTYSANNSPANAAEAHNHGNTGSTDNTMPYLTVNYIIKT